MQAKSLPEKQVDPTIGIITALPKEYAAVKAMIEKQKEDQIPGQGAGRRYLLGKVPAASGGKHSVVLSLAGRGTNIAAIRATLLLEHFPSVRFIVMVGIAGGVPHSEKPDEHVRLGDVVVSDDGGVIQYSFDKKEYDYTKEKPKITRRPPPRPPSSVLLEAVNLLEVSRIEGEKPWLEFIPLAQHLENAERPSNEMDVLTDSDNPNQVIEHPVDLKRTPGQPRVFYGSIASSNTLLKNPKLRDKLRAQYGVKAVEMETSGIADATWNLGAGYLVVRGICDYCDPGKNDVWQGYAAVVSAAYTRALLESIPCQTSDAGSVREVRVSPLSDLRDLPEDTEVDSVTIKPIPLANRKRKMSKIVQIRELLKQHFDSPTDLEELCQDIDLDMRKMRRGIITEFILDVVSEARRRKKLDEVSSWVRNRGIQFKDELEVRSAQSGVEERHTDTSPDIGTVQDILAPVDFVIVTALGEEQDAVLDKLPGYQRLMLFEDDARVYFGADLPITLPDGSTSIYQVVVMSLLGMGQVQAACATSDAIRSWRPRYVILVGIAGGIAARGVQLGDVLVADQIVDYEQQKLIPTEPETRWKVHRADPRLLGSARNLGGERLQELMRTNRPSWGEPKHHIGPIASGNKVIAFKEALARLVNAWPKLIGVEMEAAGVATAAFQAANTTRFFMVRGVSDFADEDKGSNEVERWRSYACDVAASYTIALLKSGPIRPSPIGIRVAKNVQRKTSSSKGPDTASIVTAKAHLPTPNDLVKMNQGCARLIQYDKLVQEIKTYFTQTSAPNHIVLYDYPMTEQINVFDHLSQVLSSEYVPLLITVQGSSLSRLDYFVADLAFQLTNKFNTWAKRNGLSRTLDTPNWESFREGEAEFYRHWAILREIADKRQPVVMFDEIDRLLDQPERLDARIITFLDHFVRDPDNGYFILACFERVERSENAYFNSLIDMGRPFHIRYLEEETVAAIFSIIRDYFTFEIGVLEYIIALCDGHPRVLHSMLEVITSIATKSPGKRNIGKNDLKSIETSVIERTRNTLGWLLQRLSESERCVVELISQRSSSSGDLECRLEELVDLADQRFPKSTLDRDSLMRGIIGLEKRGWIEWKNEDKGLFCFKLGILPLWLHYYPYLR